MMQTSSNILSPLNNNMDKAPIAPLCHPKRAVSYGNGIMGLGVCFGESTNFLNIALRRVQSVSCGAVLVSQPSVSSTDSTIPEAIPSDQAADVAESTHACVIESCETLSEEPVVPGHIYEKTPLASVSGDAWLARVDLWDHCECEHCLDWYLDHDIYDGFFATSEESVEDADVNEPVDEEIDDEESVESAVSRAEDAPVEIDLREAIEVSEEAPEPIVLATLAEVLLSLDEESECASYMSESTYQLGDLFQCDEVCGANALSSTACSTVESVADDEVFPVKRPAKKLGFWRRLFACGCSGN